MSDERRDDGFDFFDFNAPDDDAERDGQWRTTSSHDEGNEPESVAAGDELDTAPQEPVRPDIATEAAAPPDEEPARSGRFAMFMQAMGSNEPDETEADDSSGAVPTQGSRYGEVHPISDIGAAPDEEWGRSGVEYPAEPAAAGSSADAEDDEDVRDPWAGEPWPGDAGDAEPAVPQAPPERSRFDQFRSAYDAGDESDESGAGVPVSASGGPSVGDEPPRAGPEESFEETGAPGEGAGRFSEFMGAMRRGRGDDAPAAPGDDAPDASAGDLADLAESSSEWDAFTGEHYVRTTTQDYTDLAAEVARASDEPTMQSAVSADIPGLESGVVGLEDVAGEHAGAQLDVRTAADVGLRVLTGVGLLVLFAAALIAPVAIGVLATIVFFLAAGELSAVLIRHGYRPVVFLTLAGTLGCFVGSWVFGIIAVPVVLIMVIIVGGLLFGVASPERITTVDAALTLLVTAWIGGLGAFVFPLLGADDFRWLIAGLVIAIVAMDVGQFFVGRRLGSRPMAPVISPKKTVEGLIGGTMATIILSVGFAFFAPYDYPTGALLALAAIVLGPLGDLAVSLVKRVLGIKDMGTVLPGHGGILDRIDALLFMIPAAWVIFHNAGFLP